MNGTNGRPNILRADTIDLQDSDAPTAADHSKTLGTNGIAPHQAAQYQHVQEERRTEEQTLAEAWSMAGKTEDANAAEQSDAEVKPNGTDGEAADGAGDTDGESDDDMMDRISSSPSIDDGGSPSSPTVAGPVQRDYSTPQRAKHRSETFNQSPTSTLGSSPFVETPEHMPLGWQRSSRASLHPVQPPAMRRMSPTLHTPDTSPLLVTATFGHCYSAASQRLRPEGRYADPDVSLELDGGASCGIWPDATAVSRGDGTSQEGASVPELVHRTGSSQRDSPRNSFSWRLTKPSPSNLEESPSLMSIGSVNMQEILLPEDDPMLQEDCSPTASEGSWESASDEDADALLDPNDRFIDSGYGSECLRDTEDIDFEFVYALHTFVATVEGQANATKGDTMVLLDDSNSYWWLVRVVKDSSIGYLPAEHIETPTERLARLNKHRNIDLSQTMLGDNPERSKNPLKKAMRRRNAKTVQFAAPTYVEASDYDYSSDEESGTGDSFGGVVQQQQQDLSERGQPAEVEERNAPEEANVHATRRLSGEQTGAPAKASLDSASKTSMDSKRSSIEDPQLSPKLVDRSEAAPLKSRKGTPRNTDSFLKDDSIETRKISLTPGLLKDDSASKSSSIESARNASLENLVKTPSPQESGQKNETEKKKKEKKQGMLSGLFKSKKKDKRASSKHEIKHFDADKSSLENGRNSPREAAVASNDTSPADRVQTNPFAADFKSASQQPAAKPNASRVPPPIDTSRAGSTREMPKNEEGGFVAELEGSQAAYEMGSNTNSSSSLQQAQPTTDAPPQEIKKEGPLASLMKPSEPKPKKAKRAKQRVELDDFDSPDSEKSPNPFLEQGEREPDSDDDDHLSASPVEITSSANGTFMHGTENVHIPLHVDEDDDSDEQAEDNIFTKRQAPDHASGDTSPVLVDRPSEGSVDEDPTPTTTARQSPIPAAAPPARPAPQEPPFRQNSTTSTASSSPDSAHEISTPTSTSPPQQFQPQQPPNTTSTAAITPRAAAPAAVKIASPTTSTASSQDWDDNNLRAWLDAEEVKDLLRIVHSKHAIEPVGPDHPSMKGLWEEQRKGVQGMMGELDGLLEGFLKGRGVVFT